MQNTFEQLVLSLNSSTVSDESIQNIITILQEQLLGESLSRFVLESLSTLLQLQQWLWKSLIESFESPSFSELIQTIVTFHKTLIYDYNSIDIDAKASLIFTLTINQIDEIFNRIDQCQDDNDPFISRISSLFDNCGHFLHDNANIEKKPVVEHLGQYIISHYLMTNQYKTYLRQLREKDPPVSIFTARFLFYMKTCSFCASSNIVAKTLALNYTAEQMVNILADDYITIIHNQSEMVANWTPDLLGCMAQIVSLMCVLFWWDGQKRNQMSIILPNETIACSHVEDLIRIIAHQPFYQQTKMVRWNYETILMDSLLLVTYVIVQTQNINWFFRTNPYIQEIIISVSSAALSDETGLCGYAILGEVLNDDQLKDLKIGDNICNFFFTMLDEGWMTHDKKYKHMPITYLLKGFQPLANNDCIKQRTACLKKIRLFIDMSDLFPITYDIIWALSFNADIQEQLRMETEYLARLNQMAHHSSHDHMRKTASGILWNLNSHENNRSNGSSKQKDTFDIMISYSHKDKELCHRLYNELIKRGFRVWIDFDQMHGNVMDAMAQAIEQSQMVIVCMSEEYRRSNFCRAEAQYAFQRQLKMIPVLLQKHYKPDGWLLFLIGQLLYVDFTKHEFAKAMDMVLKELHLHSSNPPLTISTVKKTESITTTKNHPGASIEPVRTISEWTKEQVQEWLMANKLSQLSRLLKYCDGRSLVYLHRHIRNDEKHNTIQLLNEDAKRRLNEQISVIELCQFQSLIDHERRLSSKKS